MLLDLELCAGPRPPADRANLGPALSILCEGRSAGRGCERRHSEPTVRSPGRWTTAGTSPRKNEMRINAGRRGRGLSCDVISSLWRRPCFNHMLYLYALDRQLFDIYYKLCYCIEIFFFVI